MAFPDWNALVLAWVCIDELQSLAKVALGCVRFKLGIKNDEGYYIKRYNFLLKKFFSLEWKDCEKNRIASEYG